MKFLLWLLTFSFILNVFAAQGDTTKIVTKKKEWKCDSVLIADTNYIVKKFTLDTIKIKKK